MCLAMQETQVRSLGQEDPLEKGMATQSSILARRNPWTEERSRLKSMGLQTVGMTGDVPEAYFFLRVEKFAATCLVVQ